MLWVTPTILEFHEAGDQLFEATAVATLNPIPTSITPAEPSTLTLALIGIGIIAAYVAVSRRWRSQRVARRMYAMPAHVDAARIETPTRGAA